MSPPMRVVSKILPEEWLAFFVCIISVGINIFVYNQNAFSIEVLVGMLNYFTFGYEFYKFLFLGVFCFAFYHFYIYIFRILNIWAVDNIRPTKVELVQLLRKFGSSVRALLPICLVIPPTSELLIYMSYQLRFAGNDILLSSIDYNMFGRLFFIDLPTYFTHAWFTWLVFVCYVSLSFLINIFLLSTLLLNFKYIFRATITSFIISIVLSYPVFYMLPAQVPYFGIIRNFDSQLLPEYISAEVLEYNPSRLTEELSESILKSERIPGSDNVIPISCIPSMHAVWALIIVYYLFRIRKWSIFYSLPWVTLLLVGGLYFGQHYFIDYLLAVPVTILSIFFTHFLISPNKNS